MPHKNPEERKQYQKEYREKHKEKQKEYMYKYHKGLIDVRTEADLIKNSKPDIRLKTQRISQWKSRGIIFHDYNFLYELYIDTTHCNLCNVKLSENNNIYQKCLDHNHDIIDDENVRYICCRKCNGILS